MSTHVLIPTQLLKGSKIPKANPKKKTNPNGCSIIMPGPEIAL